jgi:hypothetical protein
MFCLHGPKRWDWVTSDQPSPAGVGRLTPGGVMAAGPGRAALDDSPAAHPPGPAARTAAAAERERRCAQQERAQQQGLTLVQLSAQRELFLSLIH